MGYDQHIRRGGSVTVGYGGNNWVLHALLFGHSLHEDGYFFHSKLSVRKMRKALEKAKYLNAITNQGATLDWLNFSTICPITNDFERERMTVKDNPDKLRVIEYTDGTREFIGVGLTIEVLESILNTHKPGDTYTYDIW